MAVFIRKNLVSWRICNIFFFQILTVDYITTKSNFNTFIFLLYSSDAKQRFYGFPKQGNVS